MQAAAISSNFLPEMKTKTKEKVLILFPNVHLAYSPTIINLYDSLSVDFDVTIIAPHPGRFTNQEVENRHVIYYDYKYGDYYTYRNRFWFEWLALFNKEVRFFKKNGFLTGDYFYVYRFIKDYVQREKPDHIIAVDFRNLVFGQLLGYTPHFLSLEILEKDIYYNQVDFGRIASVIIQSPERYHHLFKDRALKTFYIQNAPVYHPIEYSGNRQGLVYCGTAWDAFGFYHCLGYLDKFPEEVMTVKGAVLDRDRARIQKEYGHLLEQKRLVLDEGYVDEQHIIPYLQQFRIGFCFYNFDLPYIRTFNYYSAPSGKLFKYFAAGVPVVAVDISGLQAVNEFNCGVLIKELTPSAIRGAIEKIESNFEMYSRNCLKAAEHYSFDRTVKPFVEMLRKKVEQ